MALDVIASGRWPIAGVVAFSGRLASPEPLEPLKGSKLLLVHGTEDRMMPVAEVADAETRLSSRGVAVSSFVQPGLGHSVSAEGVAEAANFLGALFA
jgi:phospholipase/carboxylesterase